MKTLTPLRFTLAVLFIGALLTLTATAQTSATGASIMQDSLNATRISINKNAMFTLGAWALGNMAVNGTLMVLQGNQAPSERSSAYYFQQMNVFWGVVNLGLTAGGIYGAFTETPHGMSLFETVEKQVSLERILLLNAGLDVAYMAAGAWMLEHSKLQRSNNAQGNAALWQGYGQSLLLQGAFLMVFDVVVYAIHHAASEALLREILNAARFGVLPAGGLGIGVCVRW